MNPKDQFKEYRIQIGNDELIEAKVLPLIAEEPDSPEISGSGSDQANMPE